MTETAENGKKTGKNWDKENLRTVACRIRVQEAEAFRALAERMGTSAHAMLSGYVRQCLEQAARVDTSLWPNLQSLIQDNKALKRENQILKMKLEAAVSRGDHAEALVRRWLESPDGK